MKTLLKIETEAQLKSALDKNNDLISSGDIDIEINIQWSHNVRNIRAEGRIRADGYISASGY